MKLELSVKKEFDVKFLLAEVGVRYWEDATVNGVEDTEGDLIPLREGDIWKALIDVETGTICNWPQGTTASIHYKSCDENVFTLLDSTEEPIKKIEGYVIKMMCPADKGFGDYVIMNIDEKGVIENWKPDFSEFTTEED